jgi:hypothetical protein
MNWIHWPATEENNKAPWYTIIRRFVFYVPAFTTLFVFLGIVYLGWGKKTVVEMWEEII